jgi:hypothetical protein
MCFCIHIFQKVKNEILKFSLIWIIKIRKRVLGFVNQKFLAWHSLLKNKYCFAILPNNSISHGSYG